MAILKGKFWRKADRYVRCRFLHSLSRQGLQLCHVQSLRDVRDQIERVFDADRQPDCGVENAYFLADVSRNAGVLHLNKDPVPASLIILNTQ